MTVSPSALAPALLLALLSACSVAPPYQRPDMPMPATFKEAGVTWAPAASADTLERGPWWELFGDAGLNRLVQQLQLSNQNITAAVAAQAQAQAVVQQQRAGLFPAISLTGRAALAGDAGGEDGAGKEKTSRSGDTAQLTLAAAWAPDLWGRLHDSLDSAQAQAQVSQADLASARLLAQGSLVASYFQLRQTDTEIDLLQATVDGYQRSLDIAQNRYAAGLVTQTDVLQARTQRLNASADLASARQQRARLEHAVAVLTGQAPADFDLPAAPGPWVARVPDIPPGLPSTLLQRRPDIAAAERAVAAANAQIGVRRSAYFPDLSLSASSGSTGARVADLFSAPAALWSIGLSAAQTVFDAGANATRVQQAQAARDARVAVYRQTVLNALQNVEDQLIALRTLQQQEPLRRDAVAAAAGSVQQLLNRYRAGLVSYTEVLTAQSTALSAQRALLQAQVDRQLAVVGLIQALGGGWNGGQQ